MMIEGLSEVGLKRKRNEDAWGASRGSRLLVVADGLGGHSRGDEASQAAVVAVLAHGARGDDPGAAVRAAIAAAAAAVHRLAPPGATQGVPATTLVVARLDPGRVTVGWVGDARAYLWAPPDLQRLTEDHRLGRHVVSRCLGSAHEEPDVRQYALPPGAQVLLATDGLWDELPSGTLLSVLRSAPTPRAALDTLAHEVYLAGAPDNLTGVLGGLA